MQEFTMKKPEIKERTPIQPGPLTPTVQTPQCGQTVLGTGHVSGMCVTMSHMCQMSFTCHSHVILPEFQAHAGSASVAGDLASCAQKIRESHDSYVVTR